MSDSQEWVFVPVPRLVDEKLFRAAQEQLEENRTRARMGRRRLTARWSGASLPRSRHHAGFAVGGAANIGRILKNVPNRLLEPDPPSRSGQRARFL